MKRLFLLSLVLLLPQVATAYQPSLDDLYERIRQRLPNLERAIIETRTRVFDAFGPGRFPGAEGEAAPNPPAERTGRAFDQTLYWIAGELLAVETFSLQGERLHFHMEQGPRPVSKSYDEQRPFSTMDVLHPFLPFTKGTLSDWKDAAGYWGVTPQRVRLLRGEKGRMLWALEQDAHRRVVVERDSLYPVRIETWISGAREPLRLTIRFVEMRVLAGAGDREKAPVFPARTLFSVEGRLFKATHLKRFRENPPRRDFPLRRLRQTARRIAAESDGEVAPETSRVRRERAPDTLRREEG